MVTRLLPDRREAIRRLAVHLGPDGDGQLPDPPAEQLRWSRPDTVVPGWVQDAVRLMRHPGGEVHSVLRPVPGSPAAALWCSGPGWTVLARLDDEGNAPVAVLVADANPGAVTDLTVPALRDQVRAALWTAAALAAEEGDRDRSDGGVVATGGGD